MKTWIGMGVMAVTGIAISSCTGMSVYYLLGNTTCNSSSFVLLA